MKDPREFKDQIILNFIARFGNPNDEEVDLCDHEFVTEIYDFFMFRLGEGILDCIETKHQLRADAEKLAEATIALLDELSCYVSEHETYKAILESTNIDKALADFRSRWGKDKDKV